MEAVTDQPHLHPDPDDTGSSRPEGSRAFSSLDLDEQEELGGYGDQIDRSVVMSEWLKSFAMWALRMLIIAVFLYVAWFLLKQVGTGVLPVAFAIIVCTVLAPPTTWMRRKGLPPALAALISMLAFFGFFGTLIWFIAPDIARQSQILYLQTLEGVQRLQLWAQGPPLNVDGEDLSQLINDAASWVQDQAGTIAGGIVSGVGTATTVMFTLFVVIVLTFFFLKDGHRFLPWTRTVSGRRIGWHLTESLTRGWTTLGGFIRAQAIVSLVDAIFIGLGLVIVGVPMALALAVITFIAGFIPLIGAVVAGALAVLVALVSLGVTQALIVLGIVIAVQQLEGNILSPWLQSKAMNLHPVIVLVSVTIGGGLFGLIGSFLAVPFVAMIAVAFRYLMDMMALRSGEKLSEDIEWVTPEGELNGRLSEEEGRLLRERWRESIVYVDGPRRPETPGAPESPETDLDVGDDTPTTSTSGADIGRVRLSSRRIEKLFGRVGRP
ncbi:Predicted PurR-regulated permease PerM [Corynebacterium pollutisoli]|uniref:Predicted PurR-regulated permease PerM n=1 Tax=Corynebacterium pollutisoli TaxID=1610489 RepID=A0A1X7K4G6_9CORY|nr:Predicted PurR-regulated permease PerM [Corynebacterium pollutisoli]